MKTNFNLILFRWLINMSSLQARVLYKEACIPVASIQSMSIKAWA